MPKNLRLSITATAITISLLVISFLSLANITFAHGVNFFEYAPDPWQSHRYVVASGPTPSEVFQPSIATTLVAFDLWLDNTGSNGSATFTLTDADDTVLTTQTVTIPSIAAIPGGKKFHVDLPTEIPITKNSTYAIQIASSLPGFGLYSVNRLNFLEHNQDYISDYVQGLVKIGGASQGFTFKFALYQKPSGSEAPPPPPAPAPTSTIATVITNARVTAVTEKTVSLAWTTNVAADSRASIRSQLDPLYVVAIGYDSTLELEHFLTIPGLIPNVLYFADVFSNQGNEVALTTYTIGFKTAPLATSTPSQTPPPAPPQNNPPPPPSGQNPPPAGTPNSSGQNTTNPNSTPLPPPGVNGGGPFNNSFRLTWRAGEPAGSEPAGGYRIDIFDRDHNLERQIIVPAGTHGKSIAELLPGQHSAIIYANDAGVLRKIAAPITFNLKKKISLIAVLWIGGTLLIIGVIIIFGLYFKHEKPTLPAIEE